MNTPWTRRMWLTRQTGVLAVLAVRVPWRLPRRFTSADGYPLRTECTSRAERAILQCQRIDPASWQALARQGVDAARSAGARYADVRLTRIVVHEYGVGGAHGLGNFHEDDEIVGVGVRALVDGYWGFAASTALTSRAINRLAQAAVAQARENAKGTPWTVDLGSYPVATGTWSTPIRIDPFTVPIEEKLDFIVSWKQAAEEAGVELVRDGSVSWLRFARQERVIATSEGALFTQTLYESGGTFVCGIPDGQGGYLATQNPIGIEMAGAGWERLLDANIPDQLPQVQDALEEQAAVGRTTRPATVGRYTLVCDGALMAAVVEATLGVATQLDRALGYEANAGGTSFLDDPLQMVGHAKVAAPLITLTANRSAPQELATVKWDDEGVEPDSCTLIKDGVLTDFQTTREQAAWLASYYQQHGRPVRSHGCAAAEGGHVVPMQHMPNLSLEPSASPIRVEDLVADVTNGVLLEGGTVESDFQMQTGLMLPSNMREIKNGQLGRGLIGGGVLFNTKELWSNIRAIGGKPTQASFSTTQYGSSQGFGLLESMDLHRRRGKGEPAQLTSHTVRAVAATIPNQPIIDPARKA